MEPRTFSIELTPDELQHLYFAAAHYSIMCAAEYNSDKCEYSVLKTSFDVFDKIKKLMQ